MRAPTRPQEAASSSPTRPGRIRGVVAGLLAAAVALAAGELVAGLLPGARPVVITVGDTVIDLVPGPVKDLAIALFGTADKIALVAGIGILLAGFAAGVGAVATRRFAFGAAGICLLGIVGLVTALANAQGSLPAAAAPSLAATAAGLLALRVAVRPLRLASAATTSGAAGPSAQAGMDRRAFLRSTAVLATVAVGAAATGRWLQHRASATASRAAVALSRAANPLPPVPAGAEVGVDGVTPFVTPNADFYRIDTALTVPQVAVDGWTLRITGMVDNPLELSYDDLTARGLVEADVTLACVSNEVGGDLIGNARWLGVPLPDLLREAGVRPGATQLVGRSVDGFTCGFPTDIALDGRSALVAVGMNGEPLPLEHGFPARLVVPGLYGYVSATKWLSEIELTTLEAFDAYWVPRGWAKEAPIKTQSRIDVPKAFAPLSPGRVPVAGVAWAQTRGISRVEVQVDDGPWNDAELAEAVGDDTWRQWVYVWDATAGDHEIRVRATDGDGQTQPEERTQPIPDGAAGWHQVLARVSNA